MQYLVMLLLIPFGAVLSGLTLSVLWRWFVVPVFALAPLSIPQALGIALVVSFLTHQPDSSSVKKNTAETWADFMTGVFFRPLSALVLGAIYLLFM